MASAASTRRRLPPRGYDDGSGQWWDGPQVCPALPGVGGTLPGMLPNSLTKATRDPPPPPHPAGTPGRWASAPEPVGAGAGTEPPL